MNPGAPPPDGTRGASIICAPFARARRGLFAALVLGTTGLGSIMMVGIVSAAGITILEIAIVGLFVPTFSWITISFWNAVIGFFLLAAGRDPLSLERHGPIGETAVDGERPLRSRTAVVMPVHNEDPNRVVSGLASMIADLGATPVATAFDFHLLSDTTDPRVARTEEATWAALLDRVGEPGRLHYRRRPANVGRKAGNIADFLETHGDSYDFVVVLDADSVMSASTLAKLVRTMEANPDAGLIQTVPIPARQTTAFGRFIQFASALYSPMLAAGQSFWQTDAANYWGHNAILRARPFKEHCELPVLPGEPPLGGEILSHDFVEAALLRRAGWKCFLLPLLDGSHEEVPANALDYAKRDRRWAQGSLQHLRLLGEPGLHPLSRLHFVLGAMGYLSSVLWLLLLLASTAYVLIPAASGGPTFGFADGLAGDLARQLTAVLPLLGVTAFVLFAPKTLGILLAIVRQRHAYGGVTRLLISGLLEALFSVVIAPLMMMVHVQSVTAILAGRNVAWGAQQRDGRSLPWSEALGATAIALAVGVSWSAVTLYASPLFFVWLTPILTGLLCSTLLVRVTASARLGEHLRRFGLLLVPSETSQPSELNRTILLRLLAQRRSSTTPRVVRSMYEAERGLFDLRRGRPLLVTDRGHSSPGILVAAVESLDEGSLDHIRRLASGAISLTVTAARARSMGLAPNGSSSEARAGGVSMTLGVTSPQGLFRLASAQQTTDAGVEDVRPASDQEAAGLALARLGRMLPAVVSAIARPLPESALGAEIARGAILSVTVEQINEIAGASGGAAAVSLVSSAPVPLGEDENARFMLFREANGLLDHVAILIGERERWPDPVPTRLHSACLTGDLFGSLRCDCGEQLRGSLRVFEASGGGILLYLAQEGRGIGLGNKLRAYALQQQGLDTVDADSVLGFEADERRYAAAVGILRHLGIERVRLLTNNPDKVRALEESGIEVVDRQPLHGKLNRHNLPYVRAKVQRAGHWLGDMLHGTLPGS